MDTIEIGRIKNMLIERRTRVQQALNIPGVKSNYINLLKEIDSALERIDGGTYGICVVCHDPIEDEQLHINPLVRVCLGDMNEHQRRSLESDLDLANKMQRAMLPKNNIVNSAWEVNYYYQPAGVVSGDYCDIIESNGKNYFILGDVSGKGIAASMLMTHLHAMFHSMIPLELGISELVQRAGRLMCESTSTELYATLIFVNALNDGSIEICNAGHPQPIIISGNKIFTPGANGIPIGLFCDSEYTVTNIKLESGDIMFLYTDGLTETFRGDEEFGIERVSKFMNENKNLSSKEITTGIVNELKIFSDGSHRSDDITIMTIKKL